MWYKYAFSDFTIIAWDRLICHCDWDLPSFTLPKSYWLDVTVTYCVTMKISAGYDAVNSICNKKWNINCPYLYPSNRGCFVVISTACFSIFRKTAMCLTIMNKKLQKSSSSVQVFTAFCLSPDLCGASLHSWRVTFQHAPFGGAQLKPSKAAASPHHITLPLHPRSRSSTLLCCLF